MELPSRRAMRLGSPRGRGKEASVSQAPWLSAEVYKKLKSKMGKLGKRFLTELAPPKSSKR